MVWYVGSNEMDPLRSKNSPKGLSSPLTSLFRMNYT